MKSTYKPLKSSNANLKINTLAAKNSSVTSQFQTNTVSGSKIFVSDLKNELSNSQPSYLLPTKSSNLKVKEVSKVEINSNSKKLLINKIHKNVIPNSHIPPPFKYVRQFNPETTEVPIDQFVPKTTIVGLNSVSSLKIGSYLAEVKKLNSLKTTRDSAFYLDAFQNLEKPVVNFIADDATFVKDEVNAKIAISKHDPTLILKSEQHTDQIHFENKINTNIEKSISKHLDEGHVSMTFGDPLERQRNRDINLNPDNNRSAGDVCISQIPKYKNINNQNLISNSSEKKILNKNESKVILKLHWVEPKLGTIIPNYDTLNKESQFKSFYKNELNSEYHCDRVVAINSGSNKITQGLLNTQTTPNFRDNTINSPDGLNNTKSQDLSDCEPPPLPPRIFYSSKPNNAPRHVNECHIKHNARRSMSISELDGMETCVKNLANIKKLYRVQDNNLIFNKSILYPTANIEKIPDYSNFKSGIDGNNLYVKDGNRNWQNDAESCETLNRQEGETGKKEHDTRIKRKKSVLHKLRKSFSTIMTPKNKRKLPN
ncbi:unnamed protein product [Gordionus sp. m RMFG-2023]